MDNYKLVRILSTDGLDYKGIQMLRDSGIEVVEQKFSKSDLIKHLVEFDGVIVRSATTIDDEIIRAVAESKGSRLKVIARAGTGVDNIDVNAANAKGILVINTPAANTISAAEHTFALMCCLSRQIPQAHLSMKQDKWERKLFMGTELMNKTLAIIGLGRIGKEIALRAQTFGMKTIGFDPIIGSEEASKFNVEWIELNGIWPIADYITVHVPLIPQTENLINIKTFEKCKVGVKIINCARGGIVNEIDLLEALNSGKCSGAALDVFSEEPPTFKNLINHPNLITTPHLGASTVEAQQRVSIEIAENLISLSNGKRVPGMINGSILEILSMKETEQWKILLNKISQICSQLDNIRLFYDTKINCCSDKIFEGFVKNYLASVLLPTRSTKFPSINLINAHLLAMEDNLLISVAKCEGENVCVDIGLILELNGQLIKLSLVNNRIFLTRFNKTDLNQPVLLEGPGTLVITSSLAKSNEVLTNLIQNDNLVSFSNEYNSLFVLVGTSFTDKKIEGTNLTLNF